MSASDKQPGHSSNEGEAMLRHEAIAWVVRLHNSQVDEDDRRAFERWKSRSPAHRRAYQRAAQVWSAPELHAAARRTAKDAPPFSATRTFARAHSWKRYGTAVAACAVLFVLAGIYGDFLTWVRADYRTAVGEQRTITLPDQSLVTLNTRSAIALSFDASERHVRLLKGEAVFRVQPDASRPFIVESPHSVTRAVGTEFIVRAQPTRDRVTVLEGTVAVKSRRHQVGEGSLVTAGWQITSGSNFLGHPTLVDVQTVVAWFNGRLVVDGMPLEQVLVEVQRYYPGTIMLWDQDIGSTHVTGTFNIKEPSKSLSLLSKTFPLDMVRVADFLVILF